MTTLQIIGLAIAIPCIGLVCYLIYKRIYLLGYEDGIENYQKIWHKERLLLEIELRRIKKKHCLKTHPCDSCNHGWNIDDTAEENKSCRDDCDALKKLTTIFVPTKHP